MLRNFCIGVWVCVFFSLACIAASIIMFFEWLMRKKGYIFMPWDERAEILRAIKGVAEVYSMMKSNPHLARKG